MHRYPVWALDKKAVPDASNRAMPGLQDGVFPFAGWLMMDRLLADGNERPALALQPVGIGGGGNDRYKVIHFSISSISKNFLHMAATWMASQAALMASS